MVRWQSNNYLNRQNCIQLFRGAPSDNVYDDSACADENDQIICNLYQNWRPIFKISSNLSDYGGQTDSCSYWINGNNNFRSINNEIAFITDEFDPSVIDTINNYRSLVIDEWLALYENDFFSKIKVSLYKDGNEVKYFVYKATNDTLSWFQQSNMIDSSYMDSIFGTANIWDIAGRYNAVVQCVESRYPFLYAMLPPLV